MKIIVGMIVAFSLCCSCKAQNGTSVDELLRQLQAPDTAQNAGDQLMKLGAADQTVRETLSKALPGLLLEEEAPMVLQSEANLAGGLRIETAIPALVKLLAQPNELGGLTSFHRYMHLTNDPAGQALSKIGDAAVPSLSGQLKTGDVHTRSRVIRVLLLINSSASQQALLEHLPEETNSALRNMIEKSEMYTHKR